MQASHERYEWALVQALQQNAALEQACDDAAARESMFDETVANLVRAKMEHAQADAAMRQMQDDVDALGGGGGAQVAAAAPPLSPAGSAKYASFHLRWSRHMHANQRCIERARETGLCSQSQGLRAVARRVQACDIHLCGALGSVWLRLLLQSCKIGRYWRAEPGARGRQQQGWGAEPLTVGDATLRAAQECCNALRGRVM